MELAMIGLGRMGANMTRRLLKDKHRVVVFDRDPTQVDALAAERAVGAKNFQDVVSQLKTPRIVWLMVPSGDPTQKAIDDFATMLSPGDILIDGGNTYFADTERRLKSLLIDEKIPRWERLINASP